jgi:hypothetical protein
MTRPRPLPPPLPPLLLPPLLLLLLHSPRAAALAPPVASDVWPLPALFERGNESVALAAGFSLACDAAQPCPDPLPAALARYAAPGGPLFVGGAERRGALGALVVSVARAAALAPLSSVADEAYELDVPDAAAAAAGAPATLRAATQWGALRGLESFAQLVAWGGPDDAAAYRITCAPAHIADAPRFAFRGVLIDTSFNFLTVPRILDVLDSMAVMKANVLHWHILDDPAWPMESAAFPAATAPGSTGPYSSVAVYSVADQARVARYAWERGVAVLLEYDVPASAARARARWRAALRPPLPPLLPHAPRWRCPPCPAFARSPACLPAFRSSLNLAPAPHAGPLGELGCGRRGPRRCLRRRARRAPDAHQPRRRARRGRHLLRRARAAARRVRRAHRRRGPRRRRAAAAVGAPRRRRGHGLHVLAAERGRAGVVRAAQHLRQRPGRDPHGLHGARAAGGGRGRPARGHVGGELHGRLRPRRGHGRDALGERGDDPARRRGGPRRCRLCRVLFGPMGAAGAHGR